MLSEIFLSYLLPQPLILLVATTVSSSLNILPERFHLMSLNKYNNSSKAIHSHSSKFKSF